MDDITKVSIIHHVGIVLVSIWILSSLGWCHPVVYFVSLAYLYLVNEHYTSRLQRRLQFEERKHANQKRLLSDAESVRWLNHSVKMLWPICMEQIASQQFLLPIIPWFLDKYKPWTVREAVVQHLYLGRDPPVFTEIRVVHQSADDDHLVLELGLNFLSADDMSAILAVKLRKRLGFGLSAKMHITGMHVEGKVLVGLRFLRNWPFLGRVRLCFAEPPYFQMTVKPIFSRGLDVTEVPGIAGWLDNLLAVAFEQTLVEPNMLVLDVEKFVAAPTEGWFTVEEKCSIAVAKVEIIEAADMKPSDLNGLADPYVKGHLGCYRFRTKIQWKTLAPKWHEEFRVPIISWESPNLLVLEVRDKDHIFDDTLGDCSVSINELRGGQRHDRWLPLKNIKMGRLRLAITVLEGEDDHAERKELLSKNDEQMNMPKTPNGVTENDQAPDVSSLHDQKMADEFEPINIDGKAKTGLWVHRPGSDVSQAWEPRKGMVRHPETELQRESVSCSDSPRSVDSRSQHSNDNSDDDSGDENQDGNKVRRHGTFRKRLKNIRTMFHKHPKNESPKNFGEDAIPTSCPNLRAVGERGTTVRLIVDDSSAGVVGNQKDDLVACGPDKDGDDSPRKTNAKDKAKGILKHVGKTAQQLVGQPSRKHSGKSKKVGEGLMPAEEANSPAFDSLSQESPPLSMEGPLIDAVSPTVHAHDSPANGGRAASTTKEDSLQEDSGTIKHMGGSSLLRKVSFKDSDQTHGRATESSPRFSEENVRVER